MIGATDPPQAHDGRLFAPATRWDALSMLAAGLIMPAHGITHPTGRLACAAPGLLPLARGCVPLSWFAPTPEEDDMIPVLIELDVDPGDTPALVSDGVNLTALPAVVPLCRVPSLHFRSRRDADEFRARRFDTVRPEDVAFTVSPELFDHSGPEIDDALTWLNGLTSPGVQVEEVINADALAGALVLGATMEATSAAELEVRRDILTALVAAPSQTPAVDVLVGALSHETWMSRSADPDRLLLVTALSVLSASDTAGKVGSRRLIDEIRGVAQSADENDEIDRSLRAITEILRGKRELPQPRPDHGLRSAKALLLLLVRPDPLETLTWIRERPADALAVLGAVVMAGYLTGARRLPVVVKSGPATNPARRLAADRINNNHAHPLGWFATDADRALALEAVDDADAHGALRLVLGTSELVRFTPPATPTDAGEVLQAKSGLDTGGEPTEAAEPVPAPAELLTTVLSLVEAAARDPRSDLARASAEACVRLGWPELACTVVVLPADGMVCIIGGGARFLGTPPISYELELSPLRERLGGLAAAELSLFAESLSAAPGAAKPVRRRRTPAKAKRSPKTNPPA